jgi:hypothetical protein
MKRRGFLELGALLPSVFLPRSSQAAGHLELAAFEKARLLASGKRYLGEKPVTVTAATSPRSAGGPHDFFSEGDYWWPDPKNPGGPYIQRDGMSNPDNFLEHRRALLRFSVQMPALTGAWMVSGDKRFARHAADHLRAWFVDPKTLMNPHLKYSQAIHNLNTGRSTGVIDTIHLVEVARASTALERSGVLSDGDRAGIKKWFTDYLAWLTTHEYGKGERDAKNNHGTCWVMQAAEFARYTGNDEVTAFCRDRFKTVLVPHQFAADGSFPEELRRTKPYGYSLFQLDAISTVCQILSTPKDNLFTFTLPDGRGMRQALAFMFPYIEDKKRWPPPHQPPIKSPDVMYFDQWPIRHPLLVFGGLALGEPKYVELWKRLPAEPTEYETVRNYPVRQPLLWLGATPSGNG